MKAQVLLPKVFDFPFTYNIDLENKIGHLVEVPFGKIVLFSPNLFHGSVANNTEETRWSLNVRIKSLFSPYNSDEKGLGSFYSPVRLSPSTKIGLSYVQPSMRE